MKNITTEMKNTLKGVSRRLNDKEECLIKLEDRRGKQKSKKKKIKCGQGTYRTSLSILIFMLWVPRSRGDRERGRTCI